MLRNLLVALALALGHAAASAQDFAEGQVWEYDARESDQGSLLKIHQIEEIQIADETMLVYHIAISGIYVAAIGKKIDLPHAPISPAALRASVKRLVQSDYAFPDPEEGIEMWRQDEGGVFTISPSKIADIIEQAVSQN